MRALPFFDLVFNGGFEDGNLSPWIPFNASIKFFPSHTGFYSARLDGGNVNSYITQITNGSSRCKFSMALGKTSAAISPTISISVDFLSSTFQFLGTGLILVIPAGHLQDVTIDGKWLVVYDSLPEGPGGSSFGRVTINKFAQEGSADVVVDDISLLF